MVVGLTTLLDRKRVQPPAFHDGGELSSGKVSDQNELVKNNNQEMKKKERYRYRMNAYSISRLIRE